MSRTSFMLIIGIGIALLISSMGLIALLLGRNYLLITEQTVLPTPIPVMEITASGGLPTATVTEEAVETEATAVSIPTVLPTATSSPTPVAVLNTSVQTIMALTDVNIRKGPGTAYEIVGWVADGQMAKVTGISSDNGWWRVVCPDGSTGSCWVTAGNQYTQPGNAPGSSPTAVPTACTNSAALISDVSVPDGTPFLPNSGFNKIWRIKNTGTCTWDSSYQLVHAGGHLLGAVSTSFPLRDTVFPGQTIDLTINMVSPATSDTYQSDWKLQDSQAHAFGVGRNNSPFWVKIQVIDTPATTISGFIYQDANQNGVYDNGETLMAGKEVWLIPGTACHVRQNPVAVAFSGNDGRYTLTGALNGSYCVGLEGNNGLDDVVGVFVTSGQTLNNIHLKSPVPGGAISGYVWNDYCLTTEDGQVLAGNCVADGHGSTHADGMIQPTENNMAGIEVLLQVGSCTNNSAVQVAAVTDSTGRYNFGNLLPGTYCVSMNAASPHNVSRLLPGDWTFPARGIWYQELTLLAGANAYSVNFGWDYQLQ